VEGYLLSIFQIELEMQCKFVLRGARQVNAAIRDQPEAEVAWFGLQSILISASNASKLLWGAGRTDAERAHLNKARAPLRVSAGVEDDSPLNDRRVRNSFEHFDERLDRWFKKSESHIYVGRNIGPPDMVVIGDKPAEDHFGHYDPATTIVSFWDRSVEVGPIVLEVEKILRVLADLRGREIARP
jgi:hypothetical protein